MTGFVFLVVIALVFAVIWINLARRPGPKAKIGPDGTNVRDPETFVVHHEGKGQGIDIANTALKERTEHLSRDLPGDTHKVNAAIPGRDMTRMDAPPSDVSKYDDEKVAPGAVPGQPGGETKAKVLMEGPVGSRPGTPEEPGSPFGKGRRVTDTHRDVELAEEVLPAASGHRGTDRRQAVSPSTTGQEPGYGLGRTRPGETDGEGGPTTRGHARKKGPEPEEEADYPVEQPEAQDDLTDIPGGNMPSIRRSHAQTEAIIFRPDFEVGEEIVTFQPDPPAEDWSLLHEHDDLPAHYREDAVTAMVRNPRSLYVFWERGGQAEQRLREMLGEAGFQATTPCLRVFDVTAESNFAIDVGEHDDHWFVHGLEPGHRYVVSHERRAEDGRYYLLSLSEPVTTPQESAAVGTRGVLYERLEAMGNGVSSPWR